jgi:hypothetical protein
MSADIWLVHPNGGYIIVDDDIGAHLRAMVPMRSAASVDTTTFNLTYNLSPMLHAAGMPAWKDFIGMRAGDAGPIWQSVVDVLRADPDKYRAMNPPNGWGTYEGAVEVIAALAAACSRYPNATVDGRL